MQRQMGQDTILIMDSLNYIKGFRYQMYCAAREMKIRVCTVSLAAPIFRVFLTSCNEVGLRSSQTGAVPRMERRPRGRGHKVFRGNVRHQALSPPGTSNIHTRVGLTISSRDMRSPRQWFDGTPHCSRSFGRMRAHRTKISGKQ